MDRNKAKTVRRGRRKTGIRKRLAGTAERPRLTVFRSSKHIYAQVIDDSVGKTLAAATTRSKDGGDLSANVKGATEIGRRVAEAATAAGVGSVVFDRGAACYHGKVKAFRLIGRTGNRPSALPD